MTALSGGFPDRPPISFDIRPNVPLKNVEVAYRYFGAETKKELYDKAGIDGFSVWEWNAVQPDYIGSNGNGSRYKVDFWGNVYGSDYTHPTKCSMESCDSVQQLEKYIWPKITDFDYSKIKNEAENIRSQDMPVATGHIGLGYQIHTTLRGNEKALYDMCDDAYMAAYTEMITDFTLKYIKETLDSAQGLIDVFRADEDMGTMDRLMINPDMWRKYYKPCWEKAFDLVHSYGVKVWVHSCGYIAPLLEDFIEIGMDCWNPFPGYVKGNGHSELKKFRKGRIALDGGISQLVLVDGSRAEVVDETKRVLETFAPDGGLLIGPSQVLTDDIPTENIIVMFETCLNYK